MKGGHRMVSLMQSNQGNMQKKLINTQENGLLDTFHTATFTCSLSKGLTEHSLQPVAMHKITSSSHPQLCPLLSPLLTSAVPLWFSQKWCEQIRWLAGPIFISGKTCKLVGRSHDYKIMSLCIPEKDLGHTYFANEPSTFYDHETLQ